MSTVLPLRHDARTLWVVAAGLSLGSLWNFWNEVGAVQAPAAPVLILAFNLSLAAGVGYGARRLSRSEFDSGGRHRVVVWGLVGLAAFVGIALTTIGIKLIEGRVVEEPQLNLIVNGGAGTIAGLLAGWYEVRARRTARNARDAREAVEFVNGTLRHEVGNATALIHGYASDRPADLDPDLAERLSVIESQSEAIEDVVTDAQAVTSVLLGDGELDVVNLAAVAREEAETVADSHPEATVDVDAPRAVPVRGNAALGTVVGNLLNNAIDHNDSDDPTVALTLSETDGEAVLRVADDGPGVPDAEKAAIFEPDTGDNHGFGLYFVETVVDRLGGTVHVEDNELGGATFVVTLPLAD